MSSKKLRDVREEVAGCQTPLPAGGTRYSPYANLNLKIISHPSESDGCELHLKISMCLHHHHACYFVHKPRSSMTEIRERISKQSLRT